MPFKTAGLAFILSVATLLTPQSATGASKPVIDLELLATTSGQPVGISNAGDGSGRLFVLIKTGRILIYSDGQFLQPAFLDISDRVSSMNEQGLLGLAFHPDYAANGKFYVYYSDLTGANVVSRFNVSPIDPNVADPASESLLLHVEHPFAQHYGGQLQFGPDGYFYITMGDGDAGGDPENRAQNLRQLLGKILRVDVDAAEPYGIPPTNPFVGDPNARPEIWAYGLRNPWRMSFDRVTGDAYIADVGEHIWEEVNFQPASSEGGENYGWRRMEGNHCYEPPMGCDEGGLTLPFVEYSHSEGCAVIGGYVYRGDGFPLLDGVYFFADWCSGRIWATPGSHGSKRAELLNTTLTPTSFGEDEAGELYMCDTKSRGLYRVRDLRPFCDVEVEKGVYSDGETVTASVRRLVNLSGTDATVRLRAAVTRPSDPPFVLLDKGSDGSFQIEAGEDRDLGPHELFTVKPQMPRGSYTFSCLLTDPFTGQELARDDSPFEIQ